MITRAQAVLAAFTLLLVAAIAAAVIIIVASSDGGDDAAPRDLSRDLTAAAGRFTPTPTP